MYQCFDKIEVEDGFMVARQTGADKCEEHEQAVSTKKFYLYMI